jgi:hypothetical protein
MLAVRGYVRLNIHFCIYNIVAVRSYVMPIPHYYFFMLKYVNT